MGLGMYLRDVLPDAILIGYFEWWFTARTTKYLVKDFDLNTQLTCGMRNLPTHHEIAECDIGVTPTRWQKSQFPRHLQSKLHVIFDGIDENFFHPPKKNHDQRLLKLSNRETGETYSFPAQTPILSYATRGMEPLRGFPEFMRALPNAFQTIKDLHIVIAGADRCAYSHPLQPTMAAGKSTLGNRRQGTKRTHSLYRPLELSRLQVFAMAKQLIVISRGPTSPAGAFRR